MGRIFHTQIARPQTQPGPRKILIARSEQFNSARRVWPHSDGPAFRPKKKPGAFKAGYLSPNCLRIPVPPWLRRRQGRAASA